MRAEDGTALVKAVFDKAENRALNIHDCENRQSYKVCGSRWGRNGQKPALWIWNGSNWSGTPKWWCYVNKKGTKLVVKDYETTSIVAVVKRGGMGVMKAITGLTKTKVTFAQGAEIQPLLVLAACLDEVLVEVFEHPSLSYEAGLL